MGDMLGHLWWWWCSLEVTDRCLPILHRVRGLQPDSLPCSHTASAHLQWVGPAPPRRSPKPVARRPAPTHRPRSNAARGSLGASAPPRAELRAGCGVAAASANPSSSQKTAVFPPAQHPKPGRPPHPRQRPRPHPHHPPRPQPPQPPRPPPQGLPRRRPARAQLQARAPLHRPPSVQELPWWR